MVRAKTRLGPALGAVLLGVILCPEVWAQIAKVQVAGLTATQAILTYEAPDPNPCTVAVSEDSHLVPLIADVDPVKFPGSASDARFPALNRGQERTFIIGTVPKPGGVLSNLATDGYFYSRALHQNALHYFQITCGSHTAKGTFQTKVVPIGKTYGEPQPILGAGLAWRANLAHALGDLTEDSNDNVEQAQSSGTSGASPPAWNQALGATTTDNSVLWKNLGPYSSLRGKYSFPIPRGGEFSDPNWETIDPVFGTRIRHLTMAGEEAGFGGYNSQIGQVSRSFNAHGSCTNWSNPANVFAKDGRSTAYSAGTQDKCYVSFDGGLPWPSGSSAADFIRVYVFGRSSAQDGVNNVIRVCVTLDGANCAPGAPQRGIPLPARETSASDACLPIANCATPIAPIDTWSNPPLSTCQIFVTNGCNSHFGLLFWKNGTDATTTLSIDQVKVDIQASPYADPYQNGFMWPCSLTTVKDSRGNDGYLCHTAAGWGFSMFYWVGTGSASGQVRWLGQVEVPAGTFGWQKGPGYLGALTESFDYQDATKYYSAMGEGTGPHLHVVMCQLPASGSSFYNASATGPRALACGGGRGTGVWSDLTPSPRQLDVQVKAFDPQMSSLGGLGVAGVQNQYLLLPSLMSAQDTPGYLIVFDTATRTVAAATATWKHTGPNSIHTNSGSRWCVFHASHEVQGVNWWEYMIKGHEEGRGLGSNQYSTYLASAIGDAPPAGTSENIHVFDSNLSEGWGTANVAADGVTLKRVSGNAFVVWGGTGWNGLPVTVNGVADTVSHVADPQTLVLASPVPGAPLTNVRFWVNDTLGPLQAEDVINVDREWMKVTAVNGSTVTVTRGFEGTAPAAHANGATIVPQCGSIIPWFGLSNNWWDFVHDPHGRDTTGTYIRMTGERDKIIFHNGWSNGYELSEMGYSACVGDSPGNECDGQSGRPQAFLIDASPPFAGFVKHASGDAWQKHPGAPEAVNAAPAIERQWGLDDPFLDADPDARPSSMTHVSGSLWLVTMGTALNLKKDGILAVAGEKPLVDVSGPGSMIGDTERDNYKICIPYAANECVEGSSPAAGMAQTKVYVNTPRIDTKTTCRRGDIRAGFEDMLCIENIPAISALIQIGISKDDRTGSSFRQLSHVLTPIKRGGLSGQALPDGKWVIATGGFSTRSDLMLVEVPPWRTDGENRGDFLHLKIPLQPPAALGVRNAILEFGYDLNFYCASRQEACVAASADYSQANPFWYENSDVTNGNWNGRGVACSTTCTVTMPVIPGHVVYYRWKYRDGSNQVIATGPTQVEAAY